MRSQGTGAMSEVVIRERSTDDLSACVELMQQVFEADSYPQHWPDDPSGWIANKREKRAWIACVDDDEIVGHVGLHSAHDDLVTPTWLAGTSVDVDHLGVVARLFVSPSKRNMQLGSKLLDWVVARMHDEGLQPVLDVAVQRTDILAFYERKGWTRITNAEVWMPNGTPFTVVALRGPEPPATSN